MDEDIINAMTTDDFIKLYDENVKNTASKSLGEDSLDMNQLEDELNRANENFKTNSNHHKAKKVVKPALKRSTRKTKVMI